MSTMVSCMRAIESEAEDCGPTAADKDAALASILAITKAALKDHTRDWGSMELPVAKHSPTLARISANMKARRGRAKTL